MTSLLSVIFVMALTMTVSAEEGSIDNNVVKFDNGRTVEINDETNGQVSDELLKSIAEQALNETNDKEVSITISKVTKNTDIGNDAAVNSDLIQPLGLGYTDYVTSRIRTRWSVVDSARQITSVARNAVKKYTYSNVFQTRFDTSVSGGIAGLHGNVGSGLASSYTFTAQLEYYGPPAGSQYVSTIFYVTPYYNHGTWEGYRDWWLGGVDFYSGTFKEYDSYIDWSLDVK